MNRLLLTFVACLMTLVGYADPTTVMTEDFEGQTNIFGVTETELGVGKASIYASGLTGFGNVLAVCNTTAEGTISDGTSAVSTGTDKTVTVEWDAFHGWLSSNQATTVSLLNSDDDVIASYTYNVQSCQITGATIGGTAVTFDAFALQSMYTSTSNANGWVGGTKKQHYVSTAGWNPHVALSLDALGNVKMKFTINGTTTTLEGSVGTMAKNIAKIKIASNVSDTDRCYAIDNIKVTTMVDEVEPIESVDIVGASNLTFGSDPNTAYENPYSVTITGTQGTTITEDNLSKLVTDFKVTWDIEGFKTANDQEGQYCDSYGSFSTNGESKVATTFDLRNVPMNFFGKMTATITYNGTTTNAEKYVVALGDLTKASNQVLPLAGYPKDLSSYPDALVGYTLVREAYGNSRDLLVGGWCTAGSDTNTGTLMVDNDGTKFLRSNANQKKSHVITNKISAQTGQTVFTTRVRYNRSGGVVTLTSGYPTWQSKSYTNAASLSFNGTNITLNGTALTKNDASATFQTGTWYDIVLSADKTTETCYALVYDTDGNLLGKSDLTAWNEGASAPTFFSVGMDGNTYGNTSYIDMASYEAFTPIADAASYTLDAGQTTLSIPNKDKATLTASLSDVNGYPITQQATWSVLEDDMQESVVITPDANDSHKAVVSLADNAEAGTATIQVNIGGAAKTIELNLTSSEESVKFVESTTSIAIPMDEGETATASFSAQVVDGNGDDLGRDVTLRAFEKDGTTEFQGTDGIQFDLGANELKVTSAAMPMQLIIRATGKNSDNQTITKDVKVNIHGMSFDFGIAGDDAVAAGYTAVTTNTTYTAANGYGLVSGTPTAGGEASTEDATADWLEGDMQFNMKVKKGEFYTVEITYQGVLTTGYVNSDLAGYQLGSSEEMTTATFTIPATLDVIDLRVADYTANDATSVARIAKITVTKQAKRQKRTKRVVHHIGDSTSANNGSWAYRLSKSSATYPELFELCDFQNNGAGGRNLCTYYTQGKLASVLRDIYPGDIVMFGNNGTNGMGSTFEDDVNYYLDAAETLGAQIILNSYTPHGAVAGTSYASGYNSTTNTFDSYRKDTYDNILRSVAEQRAANDDNYLGFVEIGKNADAAFNAYVADYAANGYASADAAAQAIIACFPDHNHYNNAALACDLMLNGYGDVKGIVEQLKDILTPKTTTVTVSAIGWATLYTDKALDFSDVAGLEAYTATVTGNTVTMTKVEGTIPENTGVVLKATEKLTEATEFVIPAAASSTTDRGSLTGSVTDATAYNAFQGYTLYILAPVNGGKDVQFVPCNSGSIAAGKAFLKIASTNGAKAMKVVFADVTTGIKNVNGNDNGNGNVNGNGKFIKNGQLVITKDGKTYNALGQSKD